MLSLLRIIACLVISKLIVLWKSWVLKIISIKRIHVTTFISQYRPFLTRTGWMSVHVSLWNILGLNVGEWTPLFYCIWSLKLTFMEWETFLSQISYFSRMTPLSQIYRILKDSITYHNVVFFTNKKSKYLYNILCSKN